MRQAGGRSEQRPLKVESKSGRSGTSETPVYVLSCRGLFFSTEALGRSAWPGNIASHLGARLAPDLDLLVLNAFEIVPRTLSPLPCLGGLGSVAGRLWEAFERGGTLVFTFFSYSSCSWPDDLAGANVCSCAPFCLKDVSCGLGFVQMRRSRDSRTASKR